MSPPIREESGDSIGKIRLGDGTAISEVRTGAGDVLFNATQVPNSAILRWTYNEGSGTTATDSVGSNNGTLNGASYVTDRKEGSHAIECDGSDDDVTSSYFSSLGDIIGGSGSVMFWFKATSPFGSDFDQVLAEFGDSNSGLFRIWTMGSGGVEVYIGSNGKEVFTDSTTIDDGSWYHLTIAHDVSDSPETLYYIDGTQTNSGTTGLSSLSDFGLKIGSTGSRHTAGKFDDVIVTDSKVSQQEISDYINSV